MSFCNKKQDTIIGHADRLYKNRDCNSTILLQDYNIRAIVETER